MKNLLFLLIMVAIAARLNAQTPPQAKPNNQANRVDTSKQDRMPVVKPRDNSTMPVVKPRDNSTMPIVKPVPDTMVDKKKRVVPKL